MDLNEIERLHRLGLAIHWLRPKSKIPLRSGWSEGARQGWAQLSQKYKDGLNVGVRLGSASKIPGGYLAVIDLDIKSTDPKHQSEAKAKVLELFPNATEAPKVWSGRGNGSAHYYVKLLEPTSGGETLARSTEQVKVKMPSVSPSGKEQKELTKRQLENGYRLRAAWELSLMSQGRQVVLPPSIHPDTGQLYKWARGFSSLEKIPTVKKPEIQGVDNGAKTPPVESKTDSIQKFERVNPQTLGLKPEHLEMLKTGEGVEDRSAACFSICLALVQRNIPDETILSILTDKTYFLGQTAFDHAHTNRRERAAKWVERYCLSKAKQKVEETKFVTDVFDSVEDWQKNLAFIQGAKGSPLKIKASFSNAILILRNVVGEDLLKRNVFAGEDIWGLDTPWGTSAGQKRSGSNEDAVEVKEWLSLQFSVDFPVSVIEEALTWITLQNEFHPVKDYLSTLEWDGVSRVETAFTHYMGANAMPKKYIHAVTRKFFIALMKRIYEPGCKMDSMPVLEGAQGIGKSSFGRILVGEEWFLDGLPDLADKDAALSLQGIWLCEMSELSSLYRSALESAKGFIARQVDKVRPPYGRRRVDLPRSTVFLGTTNETEFLIDPTGNRRFWPLSVHQCRFKELAHDREQILAEAKFLYDFEEEALFLTGETKKLAEKIQEVRRVEDDSDAMKHELEKFLTTPTNTGIDLENFQMDEMFKTGPFQSYQINMATRKCAGKALRTLGFGKKQTMKGKRWTINPFRF